jgi:hypothetical protein
VVVELQRILVIEQLFQLVLVVMLDLFQLQYHKLSNYSWCWRFMRDIPVSTSGANSVFSTITSTGGGHGAGVSAPDAAERMEVQVEVVEVIHLQQKLLGGSG